MIVVLKFPLFITPFGQEDLTFVASYQIHSMCPGQRCWMNGSINKLFLTPETLKQKLLPKPSNRYQWPVSFRKENRIFVYQIHVYLGKLFGSNLTSDPCRNNLSADSILSSQVRTELCTKPVLGTVPRDVVMSGPN